jgi:tetratricopeptide (TPR) repeat protein
MQELKQGTQLAGRYTLVRRLGGDGESHTWLAKDRLTRASVALKITAGEPVTSDRLRAEWQTGIRLMHAHIVRAFEFHAEPDFAFYSQQFIDGPDLGVLTGSPLPEVLGPVGFLVDALAYVHAKGIVHRDLKAANVLLDTNGAPYLCDFGVSCEVGKIASGGSAVAQSPQSLQGLPASTADDIFALGGLIFELIAGVPPWPSAEMAEAIKQQAAPSLTAADGSAVPVQVEALVARMLDKEPLNRPTASEVAIELKAAGFAPRTAIIETAAPRSVPSVDEVIESVGSVRPSATPGSDDFNVIKQETTGLSPKVVGGALLALIIVLLGVVFILPKNVSENVEGPADAAPIVDIDANRSEPGGADGSGKVYVDPEVRQRVKGSIDVPTQKLIEDDDITFSENLADYSGLDELGRARFKAETTLGEFLSALEVLEGRGIELWAATEHRAARDLYEQGDRAYLQKDFAYAEELYLGALTVLEPLYARIGPTFDTAYADATAAFAAGDRLEALRLFELAVAVTPSHPGALAGYERAKNLEMVLRLVSQGIEYEEDLELEAAERSFEQAIALDDLWQPAHDGIKRVQVARTKMEFDTRMTEGFNAIAVGDYLAARAAFRVAKQLIPESSEPADGLLQVDQGLRLDQITTLEMEAQSLEQDEHWDAVVRTYEEILKVDGTLSFATEGLSKARKMSALHTRLDELIAEPDKLSMPSVMQDATMLVVDITTRQDVGPRLLQQRDELSRLLKRAATPLTVPLVSDNATQVSIYKIGRLGKFMRKELDLRPGTYVAVGSRPGFRDVRLEFRVAPEIEMQPVIVQCEEPI